MSTGFDQSETAALAALADLLVPAAEGMPAASEVGMPGPLLDQVLNSRPDLRMPLRAVLRQSRDRDPAEFIASLYRDDPDGLRTLGLVVAGGYYLSPQVRELLGYPGQVRQSQDIDAAPEYLADGTLQRVIDRGPIWREAEAS